MSDKKGIVLNRMYTGSYLSSNLGHEVINMFQADDGKHYLYLNAKGNFGNDGEKVGTMLLVRGIGNESIEVVGMAKNLQLVRSACCALPRDLGIINEKVRGEQNQLLEGIRYGEIPILKIFGEGGQQSIYVSYWVRGEDFYTPKPGVRFIIEFPPRKKKGEDNTKLNAYLKKGRYYEEEKGGTKIITIRLVSHNFASTSLHQYILSGDDLTNLTKVFNKTDANGELLYFMAEERLDYSVKCYSQRVSLFDICQIQNDENKFSNALSYFMMKYKELWGNFLEDQFDEEEIKIVSVTREEDAKVDKDTWTGVTGGRIDLLIRTNNSYVIIENKIDSSIIENEVNGNKITQLERYYNYVEYLKYDEIARIRGEITKLEKEKEDLLVKYNDPKKKHWKNREKWGAATNKLNNEITDLKKRSSEIGERKILGCVLSPNYNQPEDKLLEIERRPNLNVDWYKVNKNLPVFKWLSYRKMYKWLSDNAGNLLDPDSKDYDQDFEAFHSAMKKHTYDYESQSLYEDMKNTFFTRIQNFKNSSPNTDNNA